MLLLPEQAGYPMGVAEGGAEYVMLEVHYDNPEQLSGLEIEMEIEIYHTTELRLD